MNDNRQLMWMVYCCVKCNKQFKVDEKLCNHKYSIRKMIDHLDGQGKKIYPLTDQDRKNLNV